VSSDVGPEPLHHWQAAARGVHSARGAGSNEQVSHLPSPMVSIAGIARIFSIWVKNWVKLIRYCSVFSNSLLLSRRVGVGSLTKCYYGRYATGIFKKNPLHAFKQNLLPSVGFPLSAKFFLYVESAAGFEPNF
jgi:hypothetical protein